MRTRNRLLVGLAAAIAIFASAGFILNLTNTYSIAQFGAKCDGTTDDTSAFNQTVANAPAGAEIYVPGGTCMVAAATMNVANQVLTGEPGATLKLKSGANAYVLAVSAAGVKVQHLAILGNRSNASGACSFSCGAISVGPYASVTIDDVTASNTHDFGIYSHDAGQYTVKNSYVFDTGYIAFFSEITGSGDVAGVSYINDTCDRTANAGGGFIEGCIKVHGNSHFYTGVRIVNPKVLMPVSPPHDSSVDIEVIAAKRVVVSSVKADGGSMCLSLGSVSGFAVSGGFECYEPSSYGAELSTADTGSFGGGYHIDGNGITANGIMVDGATPGSKIAIGGGVVVNTTGSSLKVHAQSGTFTHLTVTGFITKACSGCYAMEIDNTKDFVFAAEELDGNSAALKGIILANSTDGTISADIHDFTQNGVLIYRDDGGTADNIAIAGSKFSNDACTVCTSISGGSTLGSNIRVQGNVGLNDYFDLAHNIREVWGSGTPEAAVGAGIGSIYHRLDGGSATSLYVKESGTGNTGWIGK